MGRKKKLFFESDSEAGWLGPRRPAAGQREMESVVQTRGTRRVRKDKAGEARAGAGVREVTPAVAFCLSALTPYPYFPRGRMKAVNV